MTQLRLENIHAGYKGTDVLRGISLTLKEGSCIGILGPNGAGKSTLLKTVSGQLSVRAGSRAIDDADTGRWRAYKMARAGVRWVGEPRPIFPNLSVRENLAIGGITRRDLIAEQTEVVYGLLPALKTKKDARAASLSGGQQQMLAIGQALMTKPDFLCLDEPSLGLAPAILLDLVEVIVGLAAGGVGVLWAEQFPEVAVNHCNEILVLSGGQVVASGAPESVEEEQIHAAYLGKAQDAGNP